jgi:hypothetical protein
VGRLVGNLPPRNASAPEGMPTWPDRRRSWPRVREWRARRALARMRRDISPTATGRTPPSFLARATSLAPKNHWCCVEAKGGSTSSFTSGKGFLQVWSRLACSWWWGVWFCPGASCQVIVVVVDIFVVILASLAFELLFVRCQLFFGLFCGRAAASLAARPLSATATAPPAMSFAVEDVIKLGIPETSSRIYGIPGPCIGDPELCSAGAGWAGDLGETAGSSSGRVGLPPASPHTLRPS